MCLFVTTSTESASSVTWHPSGVVVEGWGVASELVASGEDCVSVMAAVDVAG